LLTIGAAIHTHFNNKLLREIVAAARVGSNEQGFRTARELPVSRLADKANGASPAQPTITNSHHATGSYQPAA